MHAAMISLQQILDGIALQIQIFEQCNAMKVNIAKYIFLFLLHSEMISTNNQNFTN